MRLEVIDMPGNVTQKFLDIIKLPNKTGRNLHYLFVMPVFSDKPTDAYCMPYGFCLVSSALRASGRKVFTINLNYKTDPYGLLKEIIIENAINVVLTTGLSGQYTAIKKILDTVKSVNPHIITCVGGGIVTADPIATMKAFENADYGIVGEGEITINEFAYVLENNGDMHKVAGIIDRSGIMGPYRDGVSDLDILPFPDYDSFEVNSLLKDDIIHYSDSVQDGVIPMAICRSCPYQCTFCFHTCAKKYRRRSLENVCKEIDLILTKHPQINLIQFVDDLFSKDVEFLNKLTKYMKKHKLGYHIFLRVDSVSRHVLQLLKESGCNHIFFGVESADPTILKSMRKNITVEQIENAFNLSLELGLDARGFIILGDTEETPTTIGNTLNWWKNHPEYNITINWILTFPGTQIYKFACEQRIIKDRVQYLKDGNMQINITKMPDAVYWEMVRKVTLFNILSINGINIDFAKIDNVVIKIRNYLNKLPEKHKIAIWPAKFDIIGMLNEIAPLFITSQNVFFVNSKLLNPYVTACESFGKKVYTPDEILKNSDIDMVLYAHANRAKGKTVYSQIEEAIRRYYPNIKKFLKLTDCIRSNQL